MKKLSLKERYSFKTMPDLIKYMVENGYMLEHRELCHIFGRVGKELSPKYNNLCRSVKYLLNNLQGEKLDAFVDVINHDFKIGLEYVVDFATLNYKFSNYFYKCTNKETAKYLIELAKKAKETQNNSKLNELKNIIEK